MRFGALFGVTLALSAAGCACGSDEEGSGGRIDNNSGGGSAGDGSGGQGGTGGGFDPGTGGGDDPGGDSGPACESASAAATVKPVVLAIAFDVSGSMGEGDEEWHDKSLKWDPVVAATKAFLTDPASEGIAAAMTFFPERGDDDVKCVEAAYTTPDVPLTELPSTDFGDAMDAVEAEDSWRGGTPTIYVVRGTISLAQDLAAQNPEATHVLVLVTDGYPQGCGDENSIDAVVDEVTAVVDTLPTYVIGVANPPVPNAPDTVTDLHEIAEAGGTGQAFIIDTGDPAQTTADFRAAVDAIRGSAVSCTVGIPPAPPGKTFEKEKVSVTYTSGSTERNFIYDPDCAGDDSWHYDDTANPTQIVLCESTCGAVQSDPEAELGVTFTCDEQIDVR